MTEFPLASFDRYPANITAAPDGGIWFTEGFDLEGFRPPSASGFIGRIAGAVGPEGAATAFWRNIQTGDLAVWNMDGVTLKSEELVASAIPLGWKIAGRGDLDANGTLDLVWRDDEAGDVAVWLLKGADVIRAPVISSGVPFAWRIVGVGDVNGDGKADLIWHDEQTGDVAVWLMDGASVSQIPVLSAGVPLNWQIASVLDLNGDGKADLVWRFISQPFPSTQPGRELRLGQATIWLMSGATVTQAVLLLRSGPAPEIWEIRP